MAKLKSLVTLTLAVEATINALDLQPQDQAAVDLAFKYAKAIDDAGSDPEAQAKVMYVGPHLLNALRDLGATPAARKALGAEKGKSNGKLSALKAGQGT